MCFAKTTISRNQHIQLKFAWPPAKGVSEPRQQSPILVTVPFGYWTPGFLESRRIRFIVSLGGGRGFNPVPPMSGILFLGRSKITPEIDPVFHRFWKPKCSQHPSHNHSKSIPRDIRKQNPNKQQKYTEPNPAKTLTIELPCEGGASFHYFTLSKSNNNSCQNAS